MDPKIFVESFVDINKRFTELLDSLSALRTLSEIPIADQDETHLLDHALLALIENQGFERCAVFLLKQDKFEYATGADWQHLLDKGHQPAGAEAWAVDDELFMETIGSRTIQHRPDYSKTETTTPAKQGGSLMCAPVVADDTVYGVLVVHHGQTGVFNQNHERMLNLFCSFLGQILANASHTRNVVQKVQTRADQLEKALGDAEQLKQRYQELAFTDELTGLHNRRFFFPEAAAALSRATRYGHAFSVMVLDLDNFKWINDNYGHPVGDRLIKDVAAVMKDQTRYADIMARLGGEEFVFALPHTDSEGALVLANRMLERLRDVKCDSAGQPVCTTATIGIACHAGPSRKNAEELLTALVNEADQAMYYGKRHGKNQVNVYDAVGEAP